VQIQGAGSKHKTLAYSKWLAEMALRLQSPASSEQPQISSEETNPAIAEDKPFELKSISLLENLSQTCKQFKVTPNELITHINILEQLQVLDTTCHVHRGSHDLTIVRD